MLVEVDVEEDVVQEGGHKHTRHLRASCYTELEPPLARLLLAAVLVKFKLDPRSGDRT